MQSEFQILLNQIDELIKTGQVEKAREVLRKVNRNKLDRGLAPRFASLCRRVRLQDISLLALRPYVRPSERKLVLSTDEEKAEYAAALTDLGAKSEALDLLNAVNTDNFPQALLYKSFALFTRWEYADAVPLLDKYLKNSSLLQSAKIVGHANLASALLFIDDKRAESTINLLLEETRAAKYTIAEGYTEMLKAEWLMTHGRYKESFLALKEAEKIFSNPYSIESLLIKKWNAILHLFEDKKKGNSLLLEVQEEAIKRKHWETLRHCDFYKSIILKDEFLLHKLYFGTPYPAFHQKLFREFGKHTEIPTHFSWSSRSEGTIAPKQIELFPEKANGALKFGKANYRVLRALSSDFYRPQTVAELHSQIFEGDYFNPESSIGRVHQALRRARIFLKNSKLHAEIEELDGSYRLMTDLKHSIRVPQFFSTPKEGNQILLSKLLVAFSYSKPFTLKEAADALNLKNRWATQRLLRWGMQNEKLTQFGKGSKTRYQFLQQTNDTKIAA